MDERLKFVARILDGEKMAPLCREFGISRVTGYKIFNRYKQLGLEGLHDRSRRPYRHANQLPYQVERLILQIKREHPSWGAPKIRDKVIAEFSMIKPPAKSTIHAVLDRHGLVSRRKRKRHRSQGTTREHVTEPNLLWCADYKGEFMLGNKKYCYPLTVTDYSSRYLLRWPDTIPVSCIHLRFVVTDPILSRNIHCMTARCVSLTAVASALANAKSA